MARTLHELADITEQYESPVMEEISFMTSDGERFPDSKDAELYVLISAVLEAYTDDLIKLTEARELIAAQIRGDI